MIQSYTVVGYNNYTVYHIQAYGTNQARQIFKQQTGQTASRATKE